MVCGSARTGVDACVYRQGVSRSWVTGLPDEVKGQPELGDGSPG
jgi:hypothetical protein